MAGLQPDYFVLGIPELERLAACIDDRYAPDLLFLAFTGLRSGEWLGLPADAVDLHSNVVSVRQAVDQRGHLRPATGRARQVALLERARHAYERKLEVKRRLGVLDSEWAFPTPSGTHVNRANFFKQVWKPAIESAGLAGLRVHDLRHTYASLVIRAGAPAHFVSEQLGHVDAAFTMRAYAQWFEEPTETTVARLNRAFDPALRPPVGEEAPRSQIKLA